MTFYRKISLESDLSEYKFQKLSWIFKAEWALAKDRPEKDNLFWKSSKYKHSQIIKG